jgi:hypothetical protein
LFCNLPSAGWQVASSVEDEHVEALAQVVDDRPLGHYEAVIL